MILSRRLQWEKAAKYGSCRNQLYDPFREDEESDGAEIGVDGSVMLSAGEVGSSRVMSRQKRREDENDQLCRSVRDRNVGDIFVETADRPIRSFVVGRVFFCVVSFFPHLTKSSVCISAYPSLGSHRKEGERQDERENLSKFILCSSKTSICTDDRQTMNRERERESEE